MGKYQSGQMGQTVNLLAYAFGGSNPSLPTQKLNLDSFKLSRLFFYIPSRFSYNDYNISLAIQAQASASAKA